jgi:HK97 family phage major capsid protein
MASLDALIQGAQKTHDEFAAKAASIVDKAESEDRAPTEDEQKQIDAHLKSMDEALKQKKDLEERKSVHDRIRTVGAGLVDPNPKVTRESQAKSIGDQFVEADGYKAVKDAGFSGKWSTGQIELGGKATLFEGSLEAPGAGAPLAPPEVRPGIQPILFNRLTIANLIASGTTNSNVVRYVTETTATNAAATVAEGAAKPESTLVFGEVDEPVRKIATVLPVSDEMLEDAAQIRSWINARLMLFVQQEEEDQLLNGNGTAPNVSGLLDRIPAGNTMVRSAAAGATDIDHLYAGITEVRNSYLEPDGIVINPTDWAAIKTLKDGNDNYVGGNPFSGEASDSIWGKRVVATNAVAAGTALVGAFGTAAQVFRRGGLTVEATNSHSDFFVKNLTMIRAESRLALAVYRAEAFATVDLGADSTP